MYFLPLKRDTEFNRVADTDTVWSCRRQVRDWEI